MSLASFTLRPGPDMDDSENKNTTSKMLKGENSTNSSSFGSIILKDDGEF